MKENRGKNKLRRWGRVLIVFAILALVICIVKAKAGGPDADQVLTIADQGFEGHYYDAGEREKAVITFSGSEGMIGRKAPSGTSCWSYRGEELSYTPYIIREFDIIKQFRAYGEFNILSYNTGKDVTDESIIPVENIHGPILLISTEADTVWPSAEQAAHLASYLQEHDYSYEVKSLTYENVSHFAIPMRSNIWLLKLMFRSERQFPEECAAERTDLSEQAIDFIRNHW